MPEKYRGGCSQPTFGMITTSPIKELEKGPKELKDLEGLQLHRRDQLGPLSSLEDQEQHWSITLSGEGGG